VHRHPLAGHQVGQWPLGGAADGLALGLAQREALAGPLQGRGVDEDLRALHRGHAPPTDAALLQHLQGLVDVAAAQQAGPGIHAEHVVAVMAQGVAGNRLGQVVPALGPGLALERLLQAIAEVVGGHALQQLVAHPVGLDHAVVEGIGDVGGAGDQRQVRPRPQKTAGELRQAGVGHARLGVLAQLDVVGWPAEAAAIGRVGVAREQLQACHDRRRHLGGAHPCPFVASADRAVARRRLDVGQLTAVGLARRAPRAAGQQSSPRGRGWELLGGL
jgi:hypothetical protein